MAEFTYSHILKDIKTKIEQELEEELSDIDFNKIAKDALKKKHISLDLAAGLDINVLTDIIGEAVSVALNRGDWKKKIKNVELDISDLLDLNQDEINAQIKDYYNKMEKAFDKGNQELGIQMQDGFVKAFTIATQKGFKFLKKYKQEWESEYNDLLSQTKSDYRLDADSDIILNDKKGQAGLTDSAKKYQRWLMSISNQIDAYKNTSKTVGEVTNSITAASKNLKKSLQELSEYLTGGVGKSKTKTTVPYWENAEKNFDALDEKTKTLIKDLGLLNKAGQITAIKDGANNYGGLIGTENTVIVRQIEDSESAYKNTLALKKILDEAADGGIRVSQILDIVKDKEKNVILELQKTAKGTPLSAVGNEENDFNEIFNTDALRASTEQIHRFYLDLKQLWDLGAAIDVENPSNIIYDKIKGFSVIDASLIKDSGFKSFEDYWQSFVKTINDNVEDYYDKEIQTLLQGFSAKVQNLGSSLNKSLIDGIAKSTDSHSPSKEAEKQADNVVDGFVNEVNERLSDVKQVGEKIGESIKDGIKESIKEIPKEILNLQDNLGRDIGSKMAKNIQGTALVDELGRVITLYHDTFKDFEKFDISKIRYGRRGIGAYLSPDLAWSEAGWASKEYGGKTTQWYANVRRIFDTKTDQFTDEEIESIITQFLQNQSEKYKQQIRTLLQNPDWTKKQSALYDIAQKNGFDRGNWGSILSSIGIDGVFGKTSPRSSEYVIFDPDRLFKVNKALVQQANVINKINQEQQSINEQNTISETLSKNLEQTVEQVKQPAKEIGKTIKEEVVNSITIDEDDIDAILGGKSIANKLGYEIKATDELKEIHQEAENAKDSMSKVMEIWKEFGSPSNALDKGYAANVREIAEQFGEKYTKLLYDENDKRSIFNETLINEQFFKDLLPYLNLTAEKLDVVKAKLYNFDKFKPGGEWENLFISHDYDKMKYIYDVQDILTEQRDITSVELEQARGLFKALEETKQAEVEMGNQGEVATEKIKEGLQEVKEEAGKTKNILEGITLYHGSPNEIIGDFDVSRTGGKTYGSGGYFTLSKDFANKYGQDISEWFTDATKIFTSESKLSAEEIKVVFEKYYDAIQKEASNPNTKLGDISKFDVSTLSGFSDYVNNTRDYIYFVLTNIVKQALGKGFDSTHIFKELGYQGYIHKDKSGKNADIVNIFDSANILRNAPIPNENNLSEETDTRIKAENQFQSELHETTEEIQALMQKYKELKAVLYDKDFKFNEDVWQQLVPISDQLRQRGYDYNTLTEEWDEAAKVQQAVAERSAKLKKEIAQYNQEHPEYEEELEKIRQRNQGLEESKQKVKELEDQVDSLRQSLQAQSDELQHAYEEQGGLQLQLDHEQGTSEYLEGRLQEEQQITQELQTQNEALKEQVDYHQHEIESLQIEVQEINQTLSDEEALSNTLRDSVENERQLRKEAEQRADTYEEISRIAASTEAETDEKLKQEREAREEAEKQLKLAQEALETAKATTEEYKKQNANILNAVNAGGGSGNGGGGGNEPPKGGKGKDPDNRGNGTLDAYERQKELQKIYRAYQKLIQTEERYQRLVAKVNSGQNLTAKEQETLSILEQERKKHIEILGVIKAKSVASEALRKEYEDYQNVMKQVAEKYVQQASEEKNTKEAEKQNKKDSADFEKIVNAYTAQFEKLSKVIREDKHIITQDVQELYDTLSGKDIRAESSDTIQKYTSDIKELLDTLEKRGNKTKLLKNINDATIKLKENSAMPSSLAKKYKDLISEMETMEQQGNYTSKEVQEVTQKLIKLNIELVNTGKTGKSIFKEIGASLKHSVARFAYMYLSLYRLVSYIRQGVTEVSNLDKALTTISYTMNLTDAQIKNMGNDIVKLAKQLNTSVSNMSQIYQIYSNMQTSAEEMRKVAEPTAILSNLSGVDASTAADQIQGVLNQFEMAADDAKHIVDVYDYISSNISLDYSKGIAGMADAVKNVGNVANEAGLSFEQLGAIIGKVMAKTRQDGSSIGNALRTILVRTSKASKLAGDEVDNATLSNASKALHRIGIEVYTAEGEFREFDTIMSELAAQWDNLSDAEQANISFQIAATRQTSTLKAILNEFSDSMELAAEATETEGNALANQEKYTDSLAGKMQAVKNEVSDFWVSSLNSDALKEIIDELVKFVSSLNDSSSSLNTLITGLTDVAKVAMQLVNLINKFPGGLIGALFGLTKGKNMFASFNSMGQLQTTLPFLGTKTFENFGKRMFTDTDVQAFQNYINLMQQGTDKTLAWKQTMESQATPAAQQFIATQSNCIENSTMLTRQLQTQTVVTKGMAVAQTALNTVMSMGIAFLATSAISVINKVIHSQENARKAIYESLTTLEEANTQLKEHTDKVDNFISKYKEYTDALKDEHLTSQEVYDIRSDLYDLQQDINNQYGDTAKGIDIVNGKYEDQLKLLQKLTQQERKKYLAENASEYKDALKARTTYGNILDWGSQFALESDLSLGAADALKRLAKEQNVNINTKSIEEFYDAMTQMITNNILNPSEDYMIKYYFDDISKAWSKITKDSSSSVMQAINAPDIINFYNRMLVSENENYETTYTTIENLIDELKKAKSQGITFDEDITDYFRNEYLKIAKDIPTDANAGINEAFDKIQDEFTTLFIELHDYQNDLEVSFEQLLESFDGITEDELKKFINKYDLTSADALKKLLKESFLAKGNFDLVKSFYQEEMVKNLPSYSDWLDDLSNFKSDKNGNDNMSNNALINAWESTVKGFGEYIEQDEQGQVKVDFGKIIQLTKDDSLIQQLGMDTFESYIKKYGESTTAIFAYVLDAEKKLKNNLDMDFKDQDIFYQTLENIKTEALGGSISVDKLEESYQELTGVLSQVKDGIKFDKERMTELINKYPELKSAVKKYSDDSYSLQKDNLENLIDTYIEFENTAISTQLQLKKYTLETIIETANLGATVEQLAASYRSILDEDGKVKQDLSGHDYEYLFGNLEGTGKSRAEVEKAVQEYNEIREKALKQLRETIGSSNKNDKDDKDNKSNLDWLDVYLEKYNRKVDEAQKKLENLDKTTIFKDLPKKLKKQLNALGEGGNVNLKLRPEIDTEKLKDAGWEDIAEGYATVFTSTFSNATEDVAVNFTPIIVNPKTGEYLGVLSPDELQKYAEEVIAGVRKDDLNLQIGAAFTGADAIKQAEKAAKKIHKLHEKIHNLNYDIEGKYYDQREKQIKNVNEALEKQREAERVAEEETKRRMTKGELYNDLKEVAGSKKAANEYIKKIKAGEDIDLESMDSDLSSAIQALIDNWNESNEHHDKQIEIGIQIKENELQLVKDRIDEVVSQYDKSIALFERRQQELEHYQTMSTTMGHMENEKYYFALIENETRELADNIAKRDELAQELENFTPTTKEELDYWYELKGKVDEATDAIWENQEAIASWQEAIKKLEWELDDKIAELTYGVMDETNFLIDHLSSSDMYEYDRQYLGNDANKSKIYSGQMSDAGKATLALRFANYKAYLEQIEDYNKRIAEAEALYMQDTSDLENLERLNELKRMQQQVIQGYDAEKQAIIDLIKEGYDKQLESLQTLIDKYMEALQAEKDLYDYQKNIEKQTKNVAQLRKQLAAYANDTSQEGRMRLQQLTVQLEEAEESRADMEYQRRLQDQQELLDRMYQSLEDYFDDKLEDTDKLLEDSKKILEDSMPDIQTTLQESLKFDQDTSADISDTLKNILNGNITSVADNVATTDADIRALRESVVGSTADLERYYANYQLSKEQKKNLYNWIDKLNTQVNNFLGENGGFEKFIGRFNSGVIDIIDAIQEKELIDKLDDSGETISESMGTLFSYWGEYLGQNSVPTPVVDNNLKSIISTTNKPAPNVNISTSISLDNVTDYKSFINECKKDKTFEKLVQEITVNRLYGNSNSLSKRNI